VTERIFAAFIKKIPLGHILQKNLSVVTFVNEKQSVITFVTERMVATFVKKILPGHILQKKKKLSVVTFVKEKQSVAIFVTVRMVATFVKNTPRPHSTTKIVCGHIREGKIVRARFRERNKFP
jgi:hypothetical protein